MLEGKELHRGNCILPTSVPPVTATACMWTSFSHPNSACTTAVCIQQLQGPSTRSVFGGCGKRVQCPGTSAPQLWGLWYALITGGIICSEMNIYFCLLLPKHPRTASYREGQALGLWRAGAMSHQSSDLYPPAPATEAKQVEEKMAEQCCGRSETQWKIQFHSQVNYYWLELTECIFKKREREICWKWG